MSRKRQTAIFDPQGRAGHCLTTLAYDYADGYVVPEHFHREDQLLYASKGVMTIRTPHGIWVVPPLRAVWVPRGEPHSIVMSGAVSMRTLYFNAAASKSVAKKCFVVNVSPLLRELILHACGKAGWRGRVRSDRRLVDFLLDQLVVAPTIPLRLPSPCDARALRLVDILVDNPSDGRTLGELCRRAGASKRTIERAFVDETGMTFGKWRQQLRLLHAMRLLVAGEKVTSAALEAGYASPSAFIAMFRRALGQTPLRYLQSESNGG